MHGHKVHEHFHQDSRPDTHRGRRRRTRRGPRGLGRRAFMRRLRDADVLTEDDLTSFSARADAALEAGRLEQDEHWAVQHRIERMRETLFSNTPASTN